MPETRAVLPIAGSALGTPEPTASNFVNLVATEIPSLGNRVDAFVRGKAAEFGEAVRLAELASFREKRNLGRINQGLPPLYAPDGSVMPVPPTAQLLAEQQQKAYREKRNQWRLEHGMPILYNEAGAPIQANMVSNQSEVYDTAKYKQDTDRWRVEHGLPPLYGTK